VTHRPLRYDGRTLSANKDYVWGAHRAMPPEDTLARIRPHLHKAGITRVADITGLDTVGVPVAVAMRPASATLAVEGGKGLTWHAAMTSAAMEAIERFVGEVEPVMDRLAPIGEVADDLPVPADRFPMFRYASISADRAYAWAWMQDLLTDRSFLVPSALVNLPASEGAVPFAHPWAASSNGLASGNNLPEAVCAALYEVIERDATACWQLAHGTGTPQLVVEPATIDGPAIRELLEALDRAGVDVRIVWCPTDVGVPSCLAYVLDRERGVGTYKGYGCHLDPEIAMIRAVTEAVQSRTIFVAGARDDVLRPTHEAVKRSDVLTAIEFRRGGQTVSVADIPNRATTSFHGDIAVMLELLQRAGFEHVLVRELDGSPFESSVARVVIPGLETYQFQWVAVSERARGFDPDAVSS
jgi:ribosomal protein S12 methylthiotransferase accessory factor